MSGKLQEGPKVSPVTGKFVLIQGLIDVFGQMEPFKTYDISVENSFSVAIREKQGDNEIKGWLKKEDARLFTQLKREKIEVKCLSSRNKLGLQKASMLISLFDEKMANSVSNIINDNYSYCVYVNNPWLM